MWYKMPRQGHKSLTIHEDAKKILEEEAQKTGESQAELASKAIIFFFKNPKEASV